MTYHLSFTTDQNAHRAVTAFCMKTNVYSFSLEMLSATAHSLNKKEHDWLHGVDSCDHDTW